MRATDIDGAVGIGDKDYEGEGVGGVGVGVGVRMMLYTRAIHTVSLPLILLRTLLSPTTSSS